MIGSKRILITGGAGFIGSSLALQLVASNEVVILDNLHRDAMSTTTLLDHPNVTFIQGDVLDRDDVARAADGCQVIVHMASIAGVDTVMKHPVLTMKVALLGTMNVLDVAQHLDGLERLVDFSTSRSLAGTPSASPRAIRPSSAPWARPVGPMR